MNHYQEGSLIRFTVIFKDVATNTLIDPDIVEFSWRVGTDEPSAVIRYGSATVPVVGTIARLSLGTYETLGDATGVWGEAIAKWFSTGNGQATVLDPVVIDRDPF
jgi:hypothetical protein